MSRPWRCVAVPRVKRTTDRRNRELAQIHIAAKQLGLDRDTYETVLWTVARVRSAADLDAEGRRQVLEHFKSKGFQARRGSPRPGTPRNMDTADRGPMLRKIEALLAEAGRPWNYAHCIAMRVCKVDRVEFCSPPQLRKIVAALAYDQRRRSAR